MRAISLKDAERLPEADARHVVEERLQGEREHGVADVDRDGHAVRPVQCRPAAAQLRAVLDVVVDQERVVVELEHCRRAEGRLQRPAQRPAGREDERRSQSLRMPQRIVEHQVVETAP